MQAQQKAIAAACTFELTQFLVWSLNRCWTAIACHQMLRVTKHTNIARRNKLTFSIHELQNRLKEGIAASSHIQLMPQYLHHQHNAQCGDDDGEDGVVERCCLLCCQEAVHLCLLVDDLVGFVLCCSVVLSSRLRRCVDLLLHRHRGRSWSAECGASARVFCRDK